ncbi:Uncharacterised protein [Mycobacteroides abscessus subsp. abscessus]|nr:Uncharacterised protein [Mycobacteroides abscessus subsp. abscessus]
MPDGLGKRWALEQFEENSAAVVMLHRGDLEGTGHRKFADLHVSALCSSRKRSSLPSVFV